MGIENDTCVMERSGLRVIGIENDTRQKEGTLLHTTKELSLALMGIENDTCVMERRGEERRGEERRGADSG